MRPTLNAIGPYRGPEGWCERHLKQLKFLHEAAPHFHDHAETLPNRGLSAHKQAIGVPDGQNDSRTRGVDEQKLIHCAEVARLRASGQSRDRWSGRARGWIRFGVETAV